MCRGVTSPLVVALFHISQDIIANSCYNTQGIIIISFEIHFDKAIIIKIVSIFDMMTIQGVVGCSCMTMCRVVIAYLFFILSSASKDLIILIIFLL